MTGKQRAFVDAYTGVANFNATEAARIAGYANPSELGYRTKNDPEVAEEIEQRVTANAMAANEVLSRYGDQARGIGKYIEALNKNKATINVEAMLEDGMGHLIKGVKYTDAGQCIIEVYDAQTALGQIGRAHKLFTDKTESNLNESDRTAIDTLNSKLSRLAQEREAAGVPEQPDAAGSEST